MFFRRTPQYYILTTKDNDKASTRAIYLGSIDCISVHNAVLEIDNAKFVFDDWDWAQKQYLAITKAWLACKKSRGEI